MNDLPSTDGVLEQPPLLGGEPVEPRGDERVQRLGHVERLDRPGRPVDVAFAGEQAAVEQHPHRLDRVERNALGAGEDLAAQARRAGPARTRRAAPPSPRPESGSSESVVALRPPAPNVGRRSASSGRASASTNSGWLRDHSSRYSMKSSRPASAHWRSSKTSTTGALLGEALEEEPPRGEEVLAVGRGPLREPEQVGEARLEPAPLLGVGDVLLDRRAELRERRLGRLLLEDPRAHPHHLRERPVGDALAVGETAAAVPPEVVGEPVHVLLELPGEARLADPGDPDDRDELRLALLRAMRGRAP